MPMPIERYQIRQCKGESCRFRFPVIERGPSGERCPRCGAATRLVQQARLAPAGQRREPSPPGPAVDVLLDNIRSTYNVGSMFRTADGAGVRHMHLCGMTPTPEHPRTAKTALGAESAVPWTQYPDGLEAALSLKAQGLRLWALEDAPCSESLFDVIREPAGPAILLVVGNEIVGVDPGILRECERVLRIPMHGVKESLNVATAFGIAVYCLRYGGT